MARAPNIIVVLTDDQGYADMGCQGHPLLQTPNMDRLAREGIRFTDFYSGASICSPSRAALLTGCYAMRFGIARPHTHEQLDGLPAGLPTLPRLLRQNGYATGLIGKWHLGKGDDALPTRHGFDEFFGFLSTNNSFPIQADLERVAPATNWRDGASIDTMRDDVEARVFRRVPYYRGGTVSEYPADLDRMTERLTGEALEFIDRHAEQPFFLMLAHAMPHYPLGVSPGAIGVSRFRGGPSGLYGDVIERLDWSLGRILDRLESLNLSEHSILVFTSDHGGAKPSSPYATGASNAPLSGYKDQVAEGGHRVPCLLHAPGRIPAGRTEQTLFAMMDWLPTLAHAAGIEDLRLPVCDGSDFWPFLQGTTTTPERHHYAYFQSERIAAVRHGAWKLQVAGPAKAPALFHLPDDPSETTNLASRHPEKVDALGQLLQRLETEILGH